MFQSFSPVVYGKGMLYMTFYRLQQIHGAGQFYLLGIGQGPSLFCFFAVRKEMFAKSLFNSSYLHGTLGKYYLP